MLTPSDEEHLRLLSILHYVTGGLYLVGGCVPIIHLVIGLLIVTNPQAFQQGHADGPPQAFGYIFIGFALVMMLIIWTGGILTIMAGRYLKQRTNRTFTLVVAALNCLGFPLGTALGVFTFIVLCRPTVMEAYGVTPRTV